VQRALREPLVRVREARAPQGLRAGLGLRGQRVLQEQPAQPELREQLAQPERQEPQERLGALLEPLALRALREPPLRLLAPTRGSRVLQQVAGLLTLRVP
jgi:hypothetical protein